jgi:hypothetical protein
VPVPIEDDDLNQRAVLWSVTGRDEYNNVTVGPPVEINVRWKSLSEEERAATSDTVQLDSMAVVPRRVAIDSQMWLAPLLNRPALEQWYGTGSAGHENEIMTVASYHETPSLNAREVRKVVGLRKHTTTPSR